MCWPSSSTEPIGSITNILPGQTLQIVVQAVNNNLQGVMSDPIQFTIPPVGKKVDSSKPAVTADAQHELVVPATNGHANGNSRQRVTTR